MMDTLKFIEERNQMCEVLDVSPCLWTNLQYMSEGSV